MKFLFLFIALTTLSIQKDSFPGVLFAISEGSLKVFETQFLKNYFSEKNFPLSEIHLENHIPFVGGVKLDVTNNKLTFHNLTEDKIRVSFIDTDTIDVKINGLTGSIDFDYELKSGFYNNQASGNVSLTNISMHMNSSIYSLRNLKEPHKFGPGLKFNDVDIVSMDVNINFSNPGNLEKLLKFLVTNLQRGFLNIVKDKLSQDNLPDINAKLAGFLSQINLHADLPHTNLTMDYSLVEQPKIINRIIQIGFNSTMTSKSGKPYSGAAYPIPADHFTDAPVDLFVNQYVLDSLFHSLYQERATDIFIKSNFAKNSSFKLDTTYLSYAIPELKEHYGRDKPVDIDCRALKAPRIELKENETSLHVEYDTDFYVHTDGTTEIAFKSEIDVTLNTTLMISEGKVGSRIEAIKIDKLHVRDSKIGDIKGEEVAENLNIILSQGIGYFEDFLNEMLANIQMPTLYGVSFKKTDAISHKGFFQAGLSPRINKISNLDLNNPFIFALPEWNIRSRSNNLKFLE